MAPSQDPVSTSGTGEATSSMAGGSPPTEKEWELIHKFRSRVEDVLDTDDKRSAHFLLRWIRARDENLDKAEAMLRNSMKWRKENDMDSVLNKPLDPFIKDTYPYYTEGHDYEGHPVREVHSGAWDMRKAIDAGKETEFQDFVNHFFESIMVAIRESGNLKGDGGGSSDWPHTQFIYICDWEDYSYAQLINLKAVQALLKFASQYEAHYPEILYKVYFVNCPAIMPLFLKLLKPLLAPKTYSKIHIYGTNREEWEPILRGMMDPDKLWTRLGGNRVVPRTKF
ncbi:hypothetical protein Fcan01_22665 [Folsomia candida]|uniref:CRAL-TRIO domain-containing protein n=1 Tax=Folsomia candida TaxID=158441 RepID=A0A226DBM5_FOLCA|nr:hypothetical protein Fcan01_22665 [Folsomia candida]